MTRDNSPERLADSVRQSQHNEAEILAKREREAAGCREWCERHSRHAGLPNRRDGVPVRNPTHSNYPLFGE